MKVRCVTSLIGVFLVVSAANLSFGAESQPMNVSGKVVLVKLASSQVLVAYKKSDALVETISTFKIDDKTQLKNIGNLVELKINDPISIDYVESEPGNLIAKSLEKQQTQAAPSVPTQQ